VRAAVAFMRRGLRSWCSFGSTARPGCGRRDRNPVHFPLREASSWGKVATSAEQMVFGEATITMPLVVGYAFHERGWEDRPERRLVNAC
jgi:hypothetical protein